MFEDGTYSNGGEDRYIYHPGFADEPLQHIRDLPNTRHHDLFVMLEPADAN